MLSYSVILVKIGEQLNQYSQLTIYGRFLEIFVKKNWTVVCNSVTHLLWAHYFSGLGCTLLYPKGVINWLNGSRRSLVDRVLLYEGYLL